MAKKMKVLIVDNSRLYLDVLSAQACFSFIDFDFAATIADAMDLCEKNRYILISIASQLSDGGGELLLAKIKTLENNIHASIVMLTGDEKRSVKDNVFLTTFQKQDVEEFINFVSHVISQHRPIHGRVLYIEDSLTQREMNKQLMESWGMKVDAHESAEDALSSLAMGEYDLIISDIVLNGGMTGGDFVNNIRRMPYPINTIPVLAMTAFDSSERRIELFRLGINDYATKPVVAEELRSRILGLLALNRNNNHVNTLLNVSHLCVIMIDESGIICDANDETVEIFAYSKNELLGNNVSMLMPEPYHSEHDGYIHNYMLTGKRKILSEFERELTAKKKSGEEFPIYLTVDEVYRNGIHFFVGLIREKK